MKIGEIVIDSLRYPFSDWKKILILGFILLMVVILSESAINSSTKIFALILVIFSFLIELLGRGYYFRIIKTSLVDMAILPNFDSWIEMFLDGIKVYLVTIVYLIPLILLASFFPDPFKILGLSPIAIFANNSEYIIFGASGLKIWFFIAICFSLIIFPIYYMVIANMAKNNSKFTTAFQIRKIFNIIVNVGLKNLITFYIAILLPFSIIIMLTIHIKNHYK